MQRIENEEAKDIAPKARLATGGQSVVVGAGLMCPGAILGGKTVTNGASGSSLSQLARFILLEQKNNHMRETTIIREETSLKASSYPNHSSTTTSAAATTNGPLEAPFGKLANVMQPTTRQIQMNSSSSKSKSSNNDNSNPAHKEAGRQAETLIDTIMRHNEMNSGDARVRVVVATEVVAATCCKAAATSSCWPYQSSRKSATPCTALTLALVSSYCLLAVCAILGQCAPTGTHIVASTPQETRKPAYSQQQHSEQVGVVFAGQPPNHIHHNHHHHQQQRRLVLPDASGLVDVNPAANQQPIHLSHQHNLMAYAATSKQKRLQQPQQIDSVNSDGGDGGDEDASSINVQPIIVLNDHSSKPSTTTTTTTSSSSTTTAHHKLSEQLKQQQQQRDEANISMPQSAAASASSSPSHHRMLNQEQLAEQAAADDEEQLLLMLASDLASPTSFRRLIKRSGISDQRLAEIQMIRALKKQLERAANKIAAESNGGGDDGNSTKSQENTTA